MIEALYKKFLAYPQIYTDSRKIKGPGIFFAIKGPHFDGNQFAISAIQKGATAAVVSDPYLAEFPKCIFVSDSLKALQTLANYHRRQVGVKVLAITGTNGKTTTKELIHKVLSQKYDCIATDGNLNNHIGVPLTLMRLRQDTELAIIEMGASARGEIDFLCKIAEPDMGLITNVGRAHIEGFGDLDTIRITKSELYVYLMQHGGVFFKNADEPSLSFLEDQDGVICIGARADNSIRISETHQLHAGVRYAYNTRMNTLNTRLFGSHNTQNLKLAVGVALHLGLSPKDIQRALEGYQSSNNRSQIILKGSNELLLDAYNANPSSMMAVLKYFTSLDHPRKVLVLGDMLELGQDSEAEHQLIVDYIRQYAWEKVYLVGSCFAQTDADFAIKADDVSTLKDIASLDQFEHCQILLKGSRGIALERFLES